MCSSGKTSASVCFLTLGLKCDSSSSLWAETQPGPLATALNSTQGDIRIALWSRSGGSASSGQNKNTFLHIVTIYLWWVLVGSLLRQETGLSFAQQVTEMKACTSSGDAIIHECDKPSATTAWLRWGVKWSFSGNRSSVNTLLWRDSNSRGVHASLPVWQHIWTESCSF